jgi:hypothetical protein
MEVFFALMNNHSKTVDRIRKLTDKYARQKDTLNEGKGNVYQLVGLLNALEKECGELADPWLRDQIKIWLSSERRICDQIKDDFRLQLGRQLSGQLALSGRKVSGQYPVLRIGMYSIRFDFEFGEAVLFFGPEIERLQAKIPLSADAICNSLIRFDEELRSPPLDNDRFLQDLMQAYSRSLKIEGRPRGEKLPVLRVLAEYVFIKQSKKFFADPQRGHFKGFSRVGLSYDLYRFKKSGMADSGFHLHIATFDATTDKGNALWIPDNEDGEGTYYSYISMDKTELQQ